MTVIPSQRQACAAHPWCTVPADDHGAHVGDVHVLGTAQGSQVTIALEADGREPPVLRLGLDAPEVEPGSTELDPAESVELAGALLRLARTAHEARQEPTEQL